MIDVIEQINATHRRVGSRTLDAGDARSVIITSTYETDVQDLWDACTNPDRIPRWFLPVSGDLRVNGRYQLEGNAGGVIESCDPPDSFAATWEFGDQVSWIEVRFSAEGEERSRLELEHIALVDDHWLTFGPGAAGVGWDLALMGLSLHLADGEPLAPEEAMAWMASESGRQFVTESSERWRDANIEAGTDESEARAAGDRTTAFYTGAGDAPAT